MFQSLSNDLDESVASMSKPYRTENWVLRIGLLHVKVPYGPFSIISRRAEKLAMSRVLERSTVLFTQFELRCSKNPTHFVPKSLKNVIHVIISQITELYKLFREHAGVS